MPLGLGHSHTCGSRIPEAARVCAVLSCPTESSLVGRAARTVAGLLRRGALAAQGRALRVAPSFRGGGSLTCLCCALAVLGAHGHSRSERRLEVGSPGPWRTTRSVGFTRPRSSADSHGVSFRHRGRHTGRHFPLHGIRGVSEQCRLQWKKRLKRETQLLRSVSRVLSRSSQVSLHRGM